MKEANTFSQGLGVVTNHWKLLISSMLALAFQSSALKYFLFSLADPRWHPR